MLPKEGMEKFPDRGNLVLSTFPLIVTLASLGILASCSTESPKTPRQRTPQLTYRATAEQATAEHLLGRPYDSNFQPISGRRGKNLFPKSKIRRIKRNERNEWQYSSVIFKSRQRLKANASAFGLVSGGMDIDWSNRYAVLRAYHLTEYVELDDTTKMRRGSPGAHYYLWRIYYGHLYELLCYGNKRNFHAGVEASFINLGASISRYTSKYNLSTRQFARGLTPNERLRSFPKTAEAMRKIFRKSKKPEPIFVEYRTIPGVDPPPDEPIVFIKPTFQGGIYSVRVMSATIAPTKKNGNAWDVERGAPDPFVKILKDCSNEVFSSGNLKNTFRPRWSNAAKLMRLRNSSRLCFVVVDRDILDHDPIGNCSTGRLDREIFNGNRLVIENCGRVQRLEISITKK